MKQLLEAGVHFGHQTRRWNPKMAPYIYTERNGIYIIDLQKTVKKLEEAYSFVRDLSASGQNILFVGTKKQAQDAIKEEAERVGQYYVNARWLGGMMDALDSGAEDFSNEGDCFEITTNPDDFNAVADALTAKGYSFVSAEIAMVPQNYQKLESEEDIKNMEKLLDALDDDDDVQSVWHSWDQD